LVQKQIDDRAKASGRSVKEEERALLVEKEPSARFTTVEELGALAVFLCSAGASNMTGTALPMDGGWTSQ
jgi:3-hydroxybutyrate dehydrogenase